jgi:hypothetical protein
MPRLTCDAYGCGRRPILALPCDLVIVEHGLKVSIAAWRRPDPTHHFRLCRDHAAECGVEQLEQPRTFVQAALSGHTNYIEGAEA